MRRRPRRLFVLVMRLLLWALCAASFLLIFSTYNPYLLVPNRTVAIVLLSFTIVYVLMENVYGGLDIGTRKSRSIIFSMALVALFSDLAAHLFLCIMDYTVIHGGRFVYERPVLLVAVLTVQIALITGVTYLGNGIYFSFRRPQRCVMLVRRGDEYAEWLSKIEHFRKQYDITSVCCTDDDDVLRRIDEAEAVFIYNLSESERAGFVEYCYQRRKDLYYSMEMTDVILLGGKQLYFDDAAVIYAAAEKMSVEEQIIKRASDIVLSLVGLVIASPVLLAAAAAIKLEDGGDVFYRQSRATIGGRTFSIIKFRSMRPEVGGIHRSVIDDDDRITRVGRVLRKYRIDELPQLVNVLRGDMSLVGPRPEMLENVEKYTEALPQFVYRERAKAGMTGLAQVYGRYNTTPKDKLILDLLYIEHFSIWLDLKLILRTALVLLTPERSTEAFHTDRKKAPRRKRERDGGAAI